MLEIIIDEKRKGQRFDKFLLKYFNAASKSLIYKLLRKKKIKLNSKKADGNEILSLGDNIKIFLSDETLSTMKKDVTIRKTKLKADIVYEDDNIILCNKSQGILSHSDNKNSENINDILLSYLSDKDSFDDFVPGICNRLDRNTSGFVVMGKNLQTTQEINLAFKKKNVDKYYLALVKGNVDKSGTIKAYHIKKENNKVEIYNNFVEGSKEVITQYYPLKKGNGYTLLEIKLITGKSHQIRASLNHTGLYIVGDNKYGDKKTNDFFKEKYNLKNQFLHCYKLIFRADTEKIAYLKDKEFTCPLNKTMSDSLNVME